MTTSKEAKAAMTDKFITEWADQTAYVLDNEDFKGPDETEWVRFTIRHTDGGQETLGRVGNRRYERSGSLFISVFTPTEIGTSLADTLALNALTIFEGTSFSGVTINDCVSREKGANGKWYQVLVECAFLYNEVK